jgi:hypothetical protein
MEMTGLLALAPLITVIATAIAVVIADMTVPATTPGRRRRRDRLLIALAMVVGIGSSTNPVLGGTYARPADGLARRDLHRRRADHPRRAGLPAATRPAARRVQHALFAISGAMVISGARTC